MHETSSTRTSNRVRGKIFIVDAIAVQAPNVTTSERSAFKLTMSTLIDEKVEVKIAPDNGRAQNENSAFTKVLDVLTETSRISHVTPDKFS